MEPALQQLINIWGVDPNLFGVPPPPPVRPVDRQLFEAAQAGDTPHVHELLAAGAAPDAVVDGGGRTALSLAAQ